MDPSAEAAAAAQLDHEVDEFFAQSGLSPSEAPVVEKANNAPLRKRKAEQDHEVSNL
jgi:hypothetical protein